MPVSISGLGTITGLDQGLNVTGVVTATTFSGALSGTATTATNLADAANITTGTISNDRLPATITKNLTGNVTGNLTGNVTGGITTSQITVGDSFINSTAIGIGTTTTAGRNAGVSTAVGTIIYNVTTNKLEVYKSTTGWQSIDHIGDTTDGITATGGIVGDYSDGGTTYRSHLFTSTGTFDVTATPGTYGDTVDVLVVAGGGGGGSGNPTHGGGAGGGGAGGFRTNTNIPVSISPYTITIGAGGNGAINGNTTAGSDGSNSVFNPAGAENTTKITSTGGGGGASSSNDATLRAGSGGSGGGTNAGSGGQGGDGGDGGTYGQDGEDGETGDTGNNGNHTSGSAGASGTSGGTAGRAVAGSGYTIDTSGVDAAYKGLK